MTKVMSRLSKKQIIGWILTIVLPVIVLLIPANEVFTEQVRTFLMVTVAAVVVMALELFPNALIAILLPAIYVVSGITDIGTAYGAYAAQNLWMAMGAVVIGNVMDGTGLLKRISYYLIKIMGASFTGAVFAAYLAAYIVNLITFGNGWMVALPVIIGIVKALDLKPGKAATIICLAGLMGGVDSGAYIYPAATVPWLDSFIQTVLPNYTSGVLTCMAYNAYAPFANVATILIMIFFYKRSVKKSGEIEIAGNGSKEYFAGLLSEMGKISANEIKSLIVFLMLLSYTIISSVTGLPQAYGFMIIPYISFLPLVGCDNGDSIKRIPFGGLFFYASCVGIGAVAGAVGFVNMIVGLIMPLMAGKGVLGCALIMMAFTVVAKLFMTPAATIAAFCGAFVQIAMNVGMHPAAAAWTMMISTVMTFLPFGITGYLLLYSYGYMPFKEFVKNQFLRVGMYVICFICIGYPLWVLLGIGII